MAHPSLAYFLLSCEEGLQFGMFLSGERLITFLDLAAPKLILLNVACLLFVYLELLSY